MRGENESYDYLDERGVKIKKWYKPNMDMLGNKVQVGSYVIWQPYSSNAGMHIGRITKIGPANGYQNYIIKTAEGRSITRHPDEIVLYFNIVMQDLQEEKFDN